MCTTYILRSQSWLRPSSSVIFTADDNHLTHAIYYAESMRISPQVQEGTCSLSAGASIALETNKEKDSGLGAILLPRTGTNKSHRYCIANGIG